MSSNREDITTIRAVNAAAKEHEAGDSIDDEPVERVPERGLRSEILAPDDPDIEIVIDISPGVYRYSMSDNIAWNSHVAAGRNNYACATRTMLHALHSITRARIGQMLCQKHDYTKNSEAHQSGHRVHVRMLLTDADTVAICSAVDEQKQEVIRMFPTKIDKEVWRKMLTQFNRFRMSFATIREDDQRLIDLRLWSNDILRTNPHENVIRERVAA